ncbi:MULTISPECIES: siderophore-interacting protein [unclassified Streptomyces]|uniref:siderophore-interacting protein n=1 Tax=unclassified Streptomyces TaxID=2593676 RepID=UPI002253A5E1|nr:MULTISPECIES: siderophore-interacting protein [unclassified Streptomyces]MCX5140005.1 siderophore-interacting protein [Streptomyces sp. NBC_00338]WSU58598.1 siderophore-interacting protein [Streptomyces sp. NBC_01104]
MNSTGPGSSGTTRSPGVRERILGLFTLRGTVTEAEPVADRMRRLRLAGPELAGLTVLPGQQIRVHVDGLTTRRTYSVWSHDPEGSLDLCVYDHGGSGPGAAWGRSVRVGDDVRFGKPEGGFVLRPGAPHHVVIGEETASVALGAVLAALPDASGVHGVVQTATAAGRLPLAHAERLHWQVRGDASAAGSLELADAVRGLELPDPARTPGAVAYVAGEARTVQMVRGVLVRERGWDRRSVLTKPFWTPGRRGLE